MAAETVLLAVGDVAARRAELASMFRHVHPWLQRGDIVFGQLEAPLSGRGSPAPQARLPMRCAPELAPVLRAAGFTVLSCAGNHSLDWGSEALADTLAHLAAAGLAACGAGDDDAAAWAPARVTSGGVSVSFIACCSILPAGYAATVDRPGCAALGAHTLYAPIEQDQPGTPAGVHTFTRRTDLARLTATIRAERARGSIVVLSCHWGIHFVPAQLADYQREIAHAAIDAGADLVIGHHPHLLKGIEVYRGRVICYSLGNFALEQPTAFRTDVLQTTGFSEIAALNPRWQPGRAFVLPPEMRRTLLLRCILAGTAIREVALLPAWINDDAAPELLARADPRFAEVSDYVVAAGRDQGLDTELIPAGDRLVVATGGPAD